ncbi:MAG: hypothetical protein ACREFK_06195 [Stellaceae bacterium]
MAPDDESTAFHPPGLGHNGGPPLDKGANGAGVNWRLFCWKKAHRAVWKTPPREIALARLARAEALGMSYREYTALLLDRGVHL